MLVREWKDEHPETGNIALMNDGGYATLSDWHFMCFKVVKGMRGVGYGTAILKDLIDLADRMNERVTLTAGSDNTGLSTEQLVKLYKKFGFKVDRVYYRRCGDKGLDMVSMSREPRLRLGYI